MKIYFYTFPSALNQERPMLKIGQTTQEDVNVRIAQQMGTATPEKPMLMGQYEVNFTDKAFHHFLIDRGISRPDGAGTEWFCITAEEAEPLLYEFTALTDGLAEPIRTPLQLRQYQQDFVDQFVSTTGDFLLFAKCRAGKSVMGLMAAQAADFKSLLVVSLRTSAGNSWLNDPKTFTELREWDAIDLHDADAIDQIKKSQAAGRRTVMVGTVQGTDAKFSLQAKLKRLFPDGIDGLFFDECHIGGLADMVTRLRSSINFGRCLEVSGTAFRASYFYDKQHIFVWDYTKEQAAGLDMPRMNLTLVKYDASELQEVYGDDPDRLNNIWTVVDGEWQDTQSVRNFFDRYFTHGKAHKKRQLFRNSNHILVHLPSVAACQLAVETIKSMNLPWTPLDVTSASGNCQDSIFEHVASNTKTICFTVWANVVGVTVKEWDTVVFASKTDSAENWIQFAFRGGSTREDSWNVIDFAPEQALSSVIDMVQVSADAEETTEPSNAIKRFLEFAEIQEFDNGFTDVDYDGFLQLVCDQPEDAITYLTRNAQKLGSLGEYRAELAQALVGLSGLKTIKIVGANVNANGTNNKGNSKVEQTKEPTKDEMKAMLAKFKGALSAVPAVISLHAINESITSVFQLLDSPYLEPMTGLDRKGFEVAMDAGWTCERELSALVAKAALIIDAV